MAEREILAGLIVDRLNLNNPWVDHAWLPRQMLVPPPQTPAWTIIESNAERTRYYAGAHMISLHKSSTAHYRENLASGRPSLWVALQAEGAEPPLTVLTVTADPSEGEGFTETGTAIVEAIAMPADVAALVARFVEEHHVERVFVKRQRDKPGQRRGEP